MTSLSARWNSVHQDDHIIYYDFDNSGTGALTLNDESNNDDDGYLFVEPSIDFTLSPSSTITINGSLTVHGANLTLLNGSTITLDGTIQGGDSSNTDSSGNVTSFVSGDWLFYLGSGIDSKLSTSDKNTKLSHIIAKNIVRNEIVLFDSLEVVVDGSNPGKKFGHAVDLSSNGTYMICSAYRYNMDKGLVRVYKKNIDESWNQFGIDLDTNTKVKYGSRVSISDDGRFIAITANTYIHIYKRNDVTFGWDLIDTSGNDLSDLNSVQGGSPGIALNNDTFAISSPGVTNPIVTVYKLDESGEWKFGCEISAENGTNADPGQGIAKYFGKYISLNGDGSVIAISSPDQADRAGKVFIYDLQVRDESGNLRAVKKGGPIEGNISSQWSFTLDKIYLSDDGKHLAFTAHWAPTYPGHAQTFKWENGDWTHYGGAIGESGEVVLLDESGTQKPYGHSLYLSPNGKVMCVGSSSNRGTIDIWYLDEGVDKWIKYDTIVGETDNEGLGCSLALTSGAPYGGLYLSGGARKFGGVGNQGLLLNNGIVRTYRVNFLVNGGNVSNYGGWTVADTDNDGFPDLIDAFPNDASETADADGDGTGDNADLDDDNDGVKDESDAFPNDASETADADGDGVGDNADAFPNNENETADADGDGTGDNADAFPNDASETADADGDGVGDNADVFPNDPNKSTNSSLEHRWKSVEEDEHIIYADFTETLTADMTLINNLDGDEGYLFTEPGISFNIDASGNILTFTGFLVINVANLNFLTGSTYDPSGNNALIKNNDNETLSGLEENDWLFYLGAGISSKDGEDKDKKIYNNSNSFYSSSITAALTTKINAIGKAKNVAKTALKNARRKGRARKWGITEEKWSKTIDDTLGALSVNNFSNTINKSVLTTFMDNLASADAEDRKYGHTDESGAEPKSLSSDKYKAMFKEMQQLENYKKRATNKGEAATWLDKRMTFNRDDIKDKNNKHTNWGEISKTHVVEVSRTAETDESVNIIDLWEIPQTETVYAPIEVGDEIVYNPDQSGNSKFKLRSEAEGKFIISIMSGSAWADDSIYDTGAEATINNTDILFGGGETGGTGGNGGAGGTGGDPYCEPIFGNPIKLPSLSACYRLFESNGFYINASISTATEKDIHRMTEYLKHKQFSQDVIENMIYDGYFYDTFYFAYNDSYFSLNMNTLNVEYNNNNGLFTLTKEDITNPLSLLGEDNKGKQLSFSFEHTDHGTIKIMIQLYNNPQVKNGISISLYRNAEQATGLLVYNYKPKYMKLPSVTTKEYKSLHKRLLKDKQKGKNIFKEQSSVVEKNEIWLTKKVNV